MLYRDVNEKKKEKKKRCHQEAKRSQEVPMLSKKFVFPFYHLYYFPQYFPQYKFPQFAISEEKQILKEPKLRIGRCLEKSGPEGPTSVRANEAR